MRSGAHRHLLLPGSETVKKILLRGRRNVFIFEEPAARYVKLCEKQGHGDELYQIAEKWMALCFSELPPAFVKLLPPATVINRVANLIWRRLGFLDECRAVVDGRSVIISTKNELVTRIIGKNSFAAGAYAGVLGGLTGRKYFLEAAGQSRERGCEYVYSSTNERFRVPTKGKKVYNQLNSLTARNVPHIGVLPTEGIDRRGGALTFRGAPMLPVENTVLHLISNSGLPKENVANFIRSYLGRLVRGLGFSPERKMLLIKTAIETMGLGSTSVKTNEKEIVLTIANPPYGLQAEPDNWDFILRVILGGLWLLNKDFSLGNVERKRKLLSVHYLT